MIGIFRGACRDNLAGLFRSRHRSQKQLEVLKECGLVETERYWRGSVKLGTASLTTRGMRLLQGPIEPSDQGDGQAQRYRSGETRANRILHNAAVFRPTQR